MIYASLHPDRYPEWILKKPLTAPRVLHYAAKAKDRLITGKLKVKNYNMVSRRAVQDLGENKLISLYVDRPLTLPLEHKLRYAPHFTASRLTLEANLRN